MVILPFMIGLLAVAREAIAPPDAAADCFENDPAC